MNKIMIVLFLLFQSYRPINMVVNFPFSVEHETIDGQKINATSLSNDGKILVIDFWTTHCGPCILTLDAITDNYEKWNKETNTKVIAITPQNRDEKILKFLKEKDWPFEIYFDPDYQLYRALLKHYGKGPYVFSFPTMFVFDTNMTLVDKMVGSKNKFKEGVVPSEVDELYFKDLYEIDLEFYYKYFNEIKKRIKATLHCPAS